MNKKKDKNRGSLDDFYLNDPTDFGDENAIYFWDDSEYEVEEAQEDESGDEE